MRIIHKGYAATTYGKSCLTISDEDGKVVFEDRTRDVDSYKEIELRLMIEAYIKNGKRTDRE